MKYVGKYTIDKRNKKNKSTLANETNNRESNMQYCSYVLHIAYRFKRSSCYSLIISIALTIY